jgi:hypothetical protein
MLRQAMRKRNEADTEAPMIPPTEPTAGRFSYRLGWADKEGMAYCLVYRRCLR